MIHLLELVSREHLGSLPCPSWYALGQATWAREGDLTHFTSYGELGMNHLIEPKGPLQNPEDFVLSSVRRKWPRCLGSPTVQVATGIEASYDRCAGDGRPGSG